MSEEGQQGFGALRPKGRSGGRRASLPPLREGQRSASGRKGGESPEEGQGATATGGVLRMTGERSNTASVIHPGRTNTGSWADHHRKDDDDPQQFDDVVSSLQGGASHHRSCEPGPWRARLR